MQSLGNLQGVFMLGSLPAGILPGQCAPEHDGTATARSAADRRPATWTAVVRPSPWSAAWWHVVGRRGVWHGVRGGFWHGVCGTLCTVAGLAERRWGPCGAIVPDTLSG